MIEATLSYLAWFSVVLFQAVVHFWILDSRKRVDEQGSPQTEVGALGFNETNASKINPREEEAPLNEQIPRMVPHTPVSEDEDEDESFDGDEPQVFFELLEQTGSEMMKVRTNSCNRVDNLMIWPHRQF
jgi:hypothetical protein